MKAGDTFRFRAHDNHLWIVTSDPALNSKMVLIVNVTTWRRDKEQACLLGPQDHEQISHNSCIHYAGSRIYDDAHLEDLLANDKIVLHAPLRSDVLRRIREGAVASTQMKLEHGQIIIDQELVD